MRTWFPFALFFVLACGSSFPNQLARDDLQCPGNLIFTRIDDRTQKVNGCGKEVTYVEVCDAEDKCNWVRDSEVRRTQL
jgi:hypothetical protein